jgi:phage terminase large subunit-like protein
MPLLAWQRWALVHLLETVGGSYRFRTVLVLMARQNGKTTLMQVLALWRMFVDMFDVPTGLVIGTAQNLDIAEEAWAAAVEMAQGNAELALEIAHVDRSSGKKALRLTRGQRYKVAAASRRGGRSLSADLVMLDELREHQNWDSWAAVSKTTMARPDPQICGFSNAGDVSSVVLAHLRAQGLAALERGDRDCPVGLFEWSAEDRCDVTDPKGWRQANPALGVTISEAAIRAALSTDPEPVFRTEVLCQWVDSLAAYPIDPQLWALLADPGSRLEGEVAFGLDVTPARDCSAIVAAGLRPDGLLHVELVDMRPGTGWVVDRVSELAGRHGAVTVVVDEGSPAGSLVSELVATGVPMQTTSGPALAQACGQFFDLVAEKQLRHLGQLELVQALSGAARRDMGDGAWAWARRTSTANISPLVAATLAVRGFQLFGEGLAPDDVTVRF